MAVGGDRQQGIELQDLGRRGEELADRHVVLGGDRLDDVGALRERADLPPGLGEHHLEPGAGETRLAVELLRHLLLGELGERRALLVEAAVEPHRGEHADGAEGRRAGDEDDGGKPGAD